MKMSSRIRPVDPDRGIDVSSVIDKLPIEFRGSSHSDSFLYSVESLRETLAKVSILNTAHSDANLPNIEVEDPSTNATFPVSPPQLSLAHDEAISYHSPAPH